MKIQSLAVSAHIINYTGTFKCNGLFTNAINFQSASQKLITFHREGKGLSPMGWILKETDFDHISQYIQPNSSIYIKENEIIISPSLYITSQKHISLYISPASTDCLNVLENIFPILSGEYSTGLYGSLNNYQNIIKQDEIINMINMFYSWLKGSSVNWQYYLGKGPGLTPSSDDMLCGMLFSAYLCMNTHARQLSPFFEKNPDIPSLTTSVSFSYLNYAAQGIFSSYFTDVADKLANNEDILRTIYELLAIGHFSGADTLLGIALGYQAIKKYSQTYH